MGECSCLRGLVGSRFKHTSGFRWKNTIGSTCTMLQTAKFMDVRVARVLALIDVGVHLASYY